MVIGRWHYVQRFFQIEVATQSAGLPAYNERSQSFGYVECFALSSRAASLHCNARLISMSRNTGSSHCSAARVHAAAWSS
jgi:hypothetical protein